MVYIENQKLLIIETASMNIIETYNCGVCEYFSIQPGNADKFMVVCYSLQKELSLKNHEGILMIFNFNKNSKPIFEKPISDASEIDIRWSPDGLSMIMTKSSSSDSSG